MSGRARPALRVIETHNQDMMTVLDKLRAQIEAGEVYSIGLIISRESSVGVRWAGKAQVQHIDLIYGCEQLKYQLLMETNPSEPDL